MAKALEDLKVLDLSTWEAGPTATEIMGFLGADVIKVEPPGTGDPARHFSTVPLDPGVDSFYFIFFNQNKKSITLDLTKAKGVEILKEMVKKVDVLVENFTPDEAERMGLTYDDLKELNPALVVGRVSGFGSYGPYANYPCNDAVAQAMAGCFTNTGWPDKPPAKPAPSIGETGAGVNLFTGIMAAILERERTGKGQFVEVTMVDTAVNLQRVPYFFQADRDPLYKGAPSRRAGVPSPFLAPSNVYPTKDEGLYIVFMFMVQHQWDNLLRVIGHEELIGDPRFKDPQTRAQHAEIVDKLITDWTSTKSGLEAFNALASGGVSTGLTTTTTLAMNDPGFLYRKTVVEAEHPVRGKYKTLSYAPKLEKSPVEVTPAPLLGQDNEKVYAELLGYTKDDLAKLQAVGVI